MESPTKSILEPADWLDFVGNAPTGSQPLGTGTLVGVTLVFDDSFLLVGKGTMGTDAMLSSCVFGAACLFSLRTIPVL